MEIELKFDIKKAVSLDDIISDLKKKFVIMQETKNNISLAATYFDTKDMVLSSKKRTVRLRQENNQSVATAKWEDENTKSVGHYHRRHEKNVAVTGQVLSDAGYSSIDDVYERPYDLFDMIFPEMNLGEIINEKPMTVLMKTKVLREKIGVKVGQSIIEVALDKGNIEAGTKCANISEMELELLEGQETELLNLGKYIQNIYNLTPKAESKFEQGLNLLK